MKQMFTQAGVSLEESFTSAIIMVMIGLVSILPIAIVNKLFTEESKLHLNQLQATKVTRSGLPRNFAVCSKPWRYSNSNYGRPFFNGYI
ncbi:hypothetical protein AQ616_02070 [Oceanobacillus sp. E9]|nr:hypothetical protein AQ616_02070 [Oceanobacillus sp. E9]